jgi:hypothetical protein
VLDYLHVFFRWLESWSERHGHTIALLEASSTTAAVVVALVVSAAANRATRSQLKATLLVQEIIQRGDRRPTSELPTYIVVRLTNVGTVPVRLQSTCFAWRLRFHRGIWLGVPLDLTGQDENVGLRSYPLILPPNQTERIFLTDLQTFQSKVLPQIQSKVLPKMLTRRPARLLSAIVYTDDRCRFTVSFDNSFREVLAAWTLPNPRP